MAPGKPDAFFGRRAAGVAISKNRGVFKTRLTGRGGKMKNCSSGGLIPDEKTKKKRPYRRIAANYAALLRISNGVRPSFKLMRSKL